MSSHRQSLIVALLLSMNVAAPRATADAVAFWHLDEPPGATTAQDAVGDIDGTLNGSAVFVPGGVSGNAVSMTRAGNGFVTMGDHFRFGTGDFSVVGWVRTPPGDLSADSLFVGKHRATVVEGYFLGVNTSGTYGTPGKAWFYDGGFPGSEKVSTTTVNDGAWHQVVGVFRRGGQSRIYVDGAPAEMRRPAGNVSGGPAAFAIGAADFAGTMMSTFTGSVDEVQLYNHVLLDAQVQYLYENPTQTVIGPLGDMNCDGVVNFGDIDPFVLALSGQAEYEAAYPDCRHALADANVDGAVSFGDIDGFIAALSY